MTQTTNNTLLPNKADIAAHLHALFAPAFVHPYPESWIEIAYGHPGKFDGAVNAAKNFSAFEIEKAIAFAETQNKRGYNIYVGASLRQGERPKSGRAGGPHVVDASHAWAEFDGAGDEARITAILKANNLTPTLVVTTGTIPHLRAHLYFKLAGAVTREKLEAANTALFQLLGSDAVQAPSRVLRLAGTVSYPSPDKQGRGYAVELTSLRPNTAAPAYKIDALIGLAPASGEIDYFAEAGKGARRDDSEILKLLEASRVRNWHFNVRDAVAMMIGRRWSDAAIKLSCSPYCKGGVDDLDLKELIDGGRKKFNKPDVEDQPSDGSAKKPLDAEAIERNKRLADERERRLEDEADAAPVAGSFGAEETFHVPAAHSHRPLRRYVHRSDQMQERGLARSRRPH